MDILHFADWPVGRINVSGTKRLAAEKTRLEQNLKNAEQSEANLIQSAQSKRKAVEGHIATKEKELNEAKAEMKALEAKHGPLMQEANALEAKRMTAVRNAQRSPATEVAVERAPEPEPLVADLGGAIPAGGTEVEDPRITAIKQEIEGLKKELARIRLR